MEKIYIWKRTWNYKCHSDCLLNSCLNFFDVLFTIFNSFKNWLFQLPIVAKKPLQIIWSIKIYSQISEGWLGNFFSAFTWTSSWGFMQLLVRLGAGLSWTSLYTWVSFSASLPQSLSHLWSWSCLGQSGQRQCCK